MRTLGCLSVALAFVLSLGACKGDETKKSASKEDKGASKEVAKKATGLKLRNTRGAVSFDNAKLLVEVVKDAAKPKNGGRALAISYSVKWKGTVPGTAAIKAHAVCRIGELALAYRDTWISFEKLKRDGNRDEQGDYSASSLYRTDPFEDTPSLCEVHFLYDDGKQVSRIANACWKNGKLSDGTCPAAELQPTSAWDKEGIVSVERGELRIKDGGDKGTFSAVYTVSKKLPPGTLYLKSRCQSDTVTYSGEAEAPFLHLRSIRPGQSMNGVASVLVKGALKAESRCELSLVARDSSGDAPKDAELSAVCAQGSKVEPGPCEPALP